MNINKLTISILVLLFWSNLKVYSQGFIEITDGNGSEKFTFYEVALSQKNKKIDGTPYYSDNWTIGEVIIIKDKRVQSFKEKNLKYNICSETVTFLRNNKEYYVPNYNNVQSFTLADKKFVTLYNPSTKNTAFFELLFDNDEIQLLKKHECSIVVGKMSNGILPETNDKYRISTSHYIKKVNEHVKKVKLNKDLIANLFSNKIIEVNTFLKENKLNIRKENDVILIFKFYESLKN